MPSTSPTTPSTSCCLAATRWRASHWPRNLRFRGSRTGPAAARSTTWGCELAARVVERHRRRLDGRARRITIDLDPTDDPTHGAQQYSLFNGYYDNWCYLPLLAFLTFERESEQYLCAAVLRHGKAVASAGGVAMLARLLPLLRCAFPRARFLVRLDGGFASPALFDFLDAQPRLDYVVAMASNAVLLRHAEPAMLVARARSERNEQTEHLYMDTDYAAGTWSDTRRVIIKAEVVRLGDREPRDNPRFVVTNMRQTPRFLYEKVYCARGDVENRIKELKDLQLDRTSCCRLRANQLRVFLTAAAYVLMQELRLRAARTACARTQVMWLRDRLLNSASTSCAPSAASSCTCRARRRSSTRGARSPSPSGRAPGNASNASLDPRVRPPSRRSCPWPALHDGHRAWYCCSTTPSPVDRAIQTLVPPGSRADHTLPIVGQDPS